HLYCAKNIIFLVHSKFIFLPAFFPYRQQAEELSAANIRIGLLEKRADNAANDADAKVEAVNKKYDNASNEHAQKTKEYEETLDCLQADIVSLEKENQDLKKRLDAYSKKTLLTDIARQAQGGSGIASLVGSPTKSGGMGKGSVQVIIKDSPVILAQLESLKTALSQVRAENIRLKAKKLKDELAALPKIYSPPACDESHRAEDSDSNKTPVTFKTVTKDTTTLLNVSFLVFELLIDFSCLALFRKKAKFIVPGIT
ncbi:dynactin subunit 1-like, partial [Rhopilema esculentum]|uniref:dynactin subunit 1-like n=1 Tax=Rhopilema esculentum TaxID=499914 RepID=UPI0031E1443C